MKTVPSSWMYDVADLVRGDLEADDLGSGVLGVLARCGDLLEHLVEDEHAALVSLHERLAQDLGREAGGLVVHLHGCDALGGARHLEVHVAEEVLETLDVGEDDGLALLLDEAHGNARDRALDGHAGIHERQRGTAGGSHRAGAVGLSASVEPQVEAIELEPLDSMTSETTRMV